MSPNDRSRPIRRSTAGVSVASTRAVEHRALSLYVAGRKLGQGFVVCRRGRKLEVSRKTVGVRNGELQSLPLRKHENRAVLPDSFVMQTNVVVENRDTAT